MDPNSLLPRHEIERYFSIENARDKIAAEYSRAPLDAENLTKWGALLLELAQFRQGQPALDMIQEAISKFEEALKLEPRRHYTRWCLGNAYTSQGFLASDGEQAYPIFKKATRCFQQALDQDEVNVQYLRALEMSMKAPSLYHELEKQSSSQKGSRKVKPTENSKNIFLDLTCDLIGWVALAFGVAACVRLFKANMAAASVR